MTKISRITEFFDGQKPLNCGFCDGVGLRSVDVGEQPELCTWCGGTGLGSSLMPSIEPSRDHRQLRLKLGDEPVDDDGDDFLIPDPNFLSRFRKPETEAELDQAADAFGRALMAALDEIEGEQSGG